MGQGRLILYRAITRLGRSNSLHLSGDNPALTFIQEPVLGARERCGSPRRVDLNCRSPRLAGSISKFALCLLLTIFFDSLRLRFLWLIGAISPLPNEDQVACHFPKPILLNTVRTRAATFRGRRTFRAYYLLVQGICALPVRMVSQHCGHPDVPCWQPRYIGHPGRNDDDGRQTDTVCPKTALHSLRSYQKHSPIGPFFFKIKRRKAHIALYLYRNAIRARLTADGIIGQDAYVVIAGPANTYAHYVTTIEEYGVQRYEGASTLFGPCKTLFFVFGSNENRLFILGCLQIPSMHTLTNIPVWCPTWLTMRQLVLYLRLTQLLPTRRHVQYHCAYVLLLLSQTKYY
jgi:Neutral/alkaline non-lysosomal ceramidase, N-terminal